MSLFLGRMGLSVSSISRTKYQRVPLIIAFFITSFLLLWPCAFNFREPFKTLPVMTKEPLNTLPVMTQTVSLQKTAGDCRDPLSEMVKGNWSSRNVTIQEMYKVERFLTISRGKYFIPTTLARPDGICGNTTFEFLKGLQHQARWFRAVCDPYGPTPCCYKNKCVYKTKEECTCDNCYDMRTPIDAELSDWTPKNANCAIKQYQTKEACDLLKGARLYYVGDSFLRQMYIVTVNLLTGNYVDSALKSSTPIGKSSKFSYRKPTQCHLLSKEAFRSTTVLCGTCKTILYCSNGNQSFSMARHESLSSDKLYSNIYVYGPLEIKRLNVLYFLRKCR